MAHGTSLEPPGALLFWPRYLHAYLGDNWPITVGDVAPQCAQSDRHRET